jgi:DNA-binding GntR family transcriptional regulator
MGGLFMDRDMNAEEKVRAFILNSIVTRMLGPGDRVHVDLWAEAMKVSRADVCAAIVQLQRRGVVEPSDPQFATITELTPARATQEAYLWAEAQHAAFRSLLAVAGRHTTDLLTTIAGQYDSCPGAVRPVFAFAFFQIVRDSAIDTEAQDAADLHAYLMELARPVLGLPDRFDHDLHHALIEALATADESLCRRAFDAHTAALEARFGRPRLPPAS